MKIVFNLIDWPNTESFKASGLQDENWHTEYDARSNYHCAVVNWMAPTWYIELASLFEQIYEGREYEQFIPELRNDISRCGMVEKFIVSIAGEHRDDYINARIGKCNDDIIEGTMLTPVKKSREAVAYARDQLVDSARPLNNHISLRPAPRARALLANQTQKC